MFSKVLVKCDFSSISTFVYKWEPKSQELQFWLTMKQQREVTIVLQSKFYFKLLLIWVHNSTMF